MPIATRYFTDDEYNKLDSIYKAATRWVAHATFPLFILYLLFGREFIRAVFTEEYTVAWIALSVLAVGMYSRVLGGPNGMTIKAIDRTREDLLASISSIVTNTILNFVLIPRCGIEGAALATTTSFFIYNIIEIILIYRYTGVTPFHWDLVTPMLPTALVTVLFATVIDMNASSLLFLFAIGVGITVVHLLSVGVITGLRPEDKLLIEQIRGE